VEIGGAPTVLTQIPGVGLVSSIKDAYFCFACRRLKFLFLLGLFQDIRPSAVALV
jgi:hypothetical protein